MTKRIKFRLTVASFEVRSLEDLRAHFNVTEILEYADSADDVLGRWLEVHRATELADKVRALPKEPPGARMVGLTQVLRPESTPGDLDLIARLAGIGTDTTAEPLPVEPKSPVADSLEVRVRKHEQDYLDLLDQISRNCDDKRAIRESLNRIEKDHLIQFRHGYAHFLRLLSEKAPLAVVMALGMPVLRDVLLKDEVMHWALRQKVSSPGTPFFKAILPYLKEWNPSGERYWTWRALVPPSQPCLMLYLGAGAQVRGCGESACLSAEDVNGRWPLLNGIEVPMDVSYNQVIWVEV